MGMYRPATTCEAVRTSIARVVRRLQNSPRLLATLVLVLLCLSWVYIGRRTGDDGGVGGGRVAPMVMVAVLDMTRDSGEGRVIDNVLENRLEYAKAHGALSRLDDSDGVGYELAVYNATEFTRYDESERVWTKLAALRDAMNAYPQTEWFWYLDQVHPPIDLESRQYTR